MLQVRAWPPRNRSTLEHGKRSHIPVASTLKTPSLCWHYLSVNIAWEQGHCRWGYLYFLPNVHKPPFSAKVFPLLECNHCKGNSNTYKKKHCLLLSAHPLEKVLNSLHSLLKVPSLVSQWLKNIFLNNEKSKKENGMLCSQLYCNCSKMLIVWSCLLQFMPLQLKTSIIQIMLPFGVHLTSKKCQMR